MSTMSLKKLPFQFFNYFSSLLRIKSKSKRKDKDSTDSTLVNSGETKLYLELELLERKFSDIDIRLMVDLPPGLNFNEWLASHTMSLFESINIFYGTISEFCTISVCPEMIGPGQKVYLWHDEKGKKTRVSAPQYIDYVMTFIQRTISNEVNFPTKYAKDFPVSFESIVRKIMRLLFHVLSHIYTSHFGQVTQLGLHAHLNLTFAHLMSLQNRFCLIDPKETEVLRDLEMALQLTPDSQQTNNNHLVVMDQSQKSSGSSGRSGSSHLCKNMVVDN